LQKRLSPRDADPLGWEALSYFSNLFQNLIHRILLTSFPGVLGVAEGTLQVAAREPNEDGGFSLS